jgi:hypothetical protein
MNKLIVGLVGIGIVAQLFASIYHFFEWSYLPAIYHLLIALILLKIVNRTLLASDLKAVATEIVNLKNDIGTKKFTTTTTANGSVTTASPINEAPINVPAA